nr:acetoin utilization protein AcuC [Actinomycetales bacterium]
MRAALVWSEDLLAYDFGPGHPMNPLRLRLTRDLVASLRLDRHLSLLPPRIADDDELALVHEPDYVRAVRAASTTLLPDPSRGLGAGGGDMADTPVFAGMHEAAARLVGGTLEAVRAVDSGAAPRAVFFAGGMHHAMPGAAAGFCIYNDAAVAIADHLARGGGNVVYVDLDVHHGDGVERAFAGDPRVI